MFEQVIWCQNLLKFFVFTNFILYLILILIGERGYEKLHQEGYPVPSLISLIYNAIFIGIFASFGWFWFATMELISLACKQIVYFGDK